jgi:hypothetical protein
LKIHKKLIDVALPLDAINVAAAREKSIRHGHPSTLHLWWARCPLAADTNINLELNNLLEHAERLGVHNV